MQNEAFIWTQEFVVPVHCLARRINDLLSEGSIRHLTVCSLTGDALYEVPLAAGFQQEALALLSERAYRVKVQALRIEQPIWGTD